MSKLQFPSESLNASLNQIADCYLNPKYSRAEYYIDPQDLQKVLNILEKDGGAWEYKGHTPSQRILMKLHHSHMAWFVLTQHQLIEPTQI